MLRLKKIEPNKNKQTKPPTNKKNQHCINIYVCTKEKWLRLCSLYSLIFTQFIVMNNCVNSVAFSLGHNKKNRGHKFMPQVPASELKVILSGTETPLPCD